MNLETSGHAQDFEVKKTWSSRMKSCNEYQPNYVAVWH